MKNKVVIACDSMKGCLTSAEFAAAIEGALRGIDATQHIVAVPMADGGEGTVQALVAATHQTVQWAMCNVPAPLPELPEAQARYAIADGGNTALMEMAQASGLPLVPRECRDVMRASTLGTGMMLLDAVERGCSHIVLGLGGSATCDGGMGALAALGVEFFDALGHHLFPCADSLSRVADIDCSGLRDDIARTRLTLLADVSNPLCGPQGAARVFAPQKGATQAQVEGLEQGMQRWAALLGDTAKLPGAGAAGGLGAALMAFIPLCKIVPGARYIIEQSALAETLAGAQLAITGEGRIDASTALGKASLAVAEMAHDTGVPVLALCGALDPKANVAAMPFDRVEVITPPGQHHHVAMQPDVARSNIANALAHLFAKGSV